MTNPLDKLGISLDDVLADPDVNAQIDQFMADEVIPEWQRNSPVDHGTYRESVQVTKAARHGKGQVGALDPVANIIENGSEDTPAFGPRAKTEAHFL